MQLPLWNDSCNCHQNDYWSQYGSAGADSTFPVKVNGVSQNVTINSTVGSTNNTVANTQMGGLTMELEKDIYKLQSLGIALN